MRGASGGAEVEAGAAASADGDIAGGGWWVAMNFRRPLYSTLLTQANLTLAAGLSWFGGGLEVENSQTAFAVLHFGPDDIPRFTNLNPTWQHNLMPLVCLADCFCADSYGRIVREKYCRAERSPDAN